MWRLFAIALVLGRGLSGQTALSGLVTDESGAPVPEATVALRSAGQVTVSRVDTDAGGAFQFPLISHGTYSLVVTRIGFAAFRTAVRIGPDANVHVPVRLSVLPGRFEVTVSAETGRAADSDEVAQSVNLIPESTAALRLRTANVDLFEEEPGVEVQRTAPAMGGVAVRGLLGRNVAVFRDGVRFTTSTQRGGVSTFWNLTEAANLDSVEVLRGPNSAQYGSDSLGGSVHFQSRVPSLGSSPAFHGEFAPLYFTAANAFGGHLLGSYAGLRLGAVVNLSARRSNSLRPGGGIDTHAAVTRFLGLPSTIFGGRLPDTGFSQYGAMIHAQYALGPRNQLVAHLERGHQDGVKRYDQLLGGDGNLVADLRNLMLDFSYLRFAFFPAAFFQQIVLTASYNAQREERVNQGGNGNPLARITHQYERTRAWGTSFLLTKKLGGGDMLLGGDGYSERTRTPSFTFHPATGITSVTRPRIPDRARYLLYGLYLQHVWEPLASGTLRLSGAMRFGGSSYQSRARHSQIIAGQPLWPDDSLAANAVTGRLGATWRIGEPFRLHFNFSRGFRAPNITDLGSVGLQGNGMFETSYADLIGRGAMVGNRADDRALSSGRAVAPVRPETSDNYEAGFSWRLSPVRGDVRSFRISLNDTLASRTLILPPGQAGQALGDQIITRQLPGGAVFVPATTGPVLVRSNLGDVRLRGLEYQSEARLPASLTLAGNLTWIHAEDARTLLPPDIEGGIPPLTANLRLRWAPAAAGYWIEIYSSLADRQDRLSSLALADRRTGAARSRSNIESFFHQGATVRGLVAGEVLLPTGETLPQVQDRVLPQAASAPMFTAVPGYAVHGIRAGWQHRDRSSVFVDLGNLLDKSHRGVNWGINGPGRSLTLRYRYQF
ncbi:MAG: TonB-dependent receptor [Acidimicrobiia bacterium]|nr:TonB-dependent receptor [Acidimicrobiia bacterium]